MTEKQIAHLSFKIWKKEHKILRKLAAEKEISISELVRQIINAYLKETYDHE